MNTMQTKLKEMAGQGVHLIKPNLVNLSSSQYKIDLHGTLRVVDDIGWLEVIVDSTLRVGFLDAIIAEIQEDVNDPDYVHYNIILEPDEP